jgi:YggT family protein
MNELHYIARWVFGFLVGVFLLRLLFQLARTDFRNPLVGAVVRLTNPLVLPLRRVFPPIARVDSASVLAVLIVQLLGTTVLTVLSGLGLPPVVWLVVRAIVDLVDATLWLFVFAVIAYVVLSWFAPDGYSPAGRVLEDLVEPLLRPFRRALPTLGGLDFSPFILILVLSVLRIVLNDRIEPLLLRMLSG